MAKGAAISNLEAIHNAEDEVEAVGVLVASSGAKAVC